MRILITGAFGFVGRNLSAYLAAHGHLVLALDVAPQALAAYSAFYSWDELDRIEWGRVDAVIHLAGKAHDTRNTGDPKSYFDVNVGLTKQVVNAWLRGIACSAKAEPSADPLNAFVKKLILFSSVKAVADRVEGVLTEEAVPDPRTPYGKSKLESEKEVLKFESSKLLEPETANGAKQANEDNFNTLELSNFRTYILRPCMIHGPGNKGNLNLLYGMVRKGIPWPLGAFENRRSFASVGNVCATVEGLMAVDVPSGVYQVADDEALSTNELIGLMAEALERRTRVWKIPPGLICFVARLGDVLRLPLNSERLKKLTESYVVSNAKVKRALGWDSMPTRAEEGMRKTLESFGNRQ